MKILTTLFLILRLCLVQIKAQDNKASFLFQIVEDGQIKFIDETGRIVWQAK